MTSFLDSRILFLQFSKTKTLNYFQSETKKKNEKN